MDEVGRLRFEFSTGSLVKKAEMVKEGRLEAFSSELLSRLTEFDTIKGITRS